MRTKVVLIPFPIILSKKEISTEITAIVWVTYCYTLKCGMVSDDHSGIGEYDGVLQTTNESNKNLPILNKLFCSEYGMISRWVRYHLCGGNYPSGVKLQNNQFIPLGKIPARHHFLSIFVANLCVLLGYHLFANLFDAKIAFITFALFIVSPIGTQAIAWCSALGYPLSLFWILSILNFLQWFHQVPHDTSDTILAIVAFIILDFMAINALFVAIALPAILILLGYHTFAIVAVIISLVMGFRIVRHTIKIRSDEFKKQDMGKLTQFTPRRIILAIKTLLYYFELVLWPNRLGLYHEWGNHPNAEHSREDRRFLIGLFSVCGLIAIFFLTPIFAVKFGILWFFAFIFIFLNWITIQQFVTERYLWIPSIGFYLIVAATLSDYPYALFLIGGIYLARTWLHLPTYDDELRFYLSNTWNYQNSEVAYANLGCTFIRLGAVGSALDAWHASSKANPDYDVPYANIYFNHRAGAMLDVEHGNYENAIEKFRVAHKYIQACCNCSVKHFKDDWDRELKSVTAWLQNPLILVVAEKKRLTELRQSLTERRAKPGEKDFVGIDESLAHITQRLLHIESILSKAPKEQIPNESTVEPTKLLLPGQENK